jgi:hypothetical protein
VKSFLNRKNSRFVICLVAAVMTGEIIRFIIGRSLISSVLAILEIPCVGYLVYCYASKKSANPDRKATPSKIRRLYLMAFQWCGWLFVAFGTFLLLYMVIDGSGVQAQNDVSDYLRAISMIILVVVAGVCFIALSKPRKNK